jgi:putative sigma-54 modulation protein
MAEDKSGFEIEIRGHHFEPGPELMDYTTAHVEKLGRYFDGLHRMEVILRQDNGAQFQAELLAHVVRGKQLVAEGTSKDAMTGAIDAAVDRMERQLVRFKERLRDRRTHG